MVNSMIVGFAKDSESAIELLQHNSILNAIYIGEDYLKAITNIDNMVENKDENIKEVFNVDELSELLMSLYITPNLCGFKYIIESIKILLNKPNASYTKEIYPEVAKKFSSEASRVERGIRHAIERGWLKLLPNNKLAVKIFRAERFYDSTKPTNSEFISTIANYLQSNRG